MADIYIIESGVSPVKIYFDGRNWATTRAEAFEYETQFDADQALDFHRLEDGSVVPDLPHEQFAGLYR